jgi:hypothetical protein
LTHPVPVPYVGSVHHHSTMSIYTDNGYSNRKEYLNELREDYGDLVNILTGVLPASEDFDGLVTALEDAMDSGEYEDLM